jgi:flagellar motor switch protein FliN/FliY
VPDKSSERPEQTAGSPGDGLMDFVSDVPLRVTVEIGATRLLLREVLALDEGSVVELDRDSGELADILVNGRLVARGDVTNVDDRLAIRIVEFAKGDTK